MSFVQTETLLEDLQVLLIAQPGRLADLVVEFYQDQQIKVELLSLNHNQCLESLVEIVNDNLLEKYYKIITIFDISRLTSNKVSLCQRIIDILQPVQTPQVYLVGISSKIDATSPLFKEWQQQTTLEDSLISHLYSSPFSKKIIIGQDLIYQDDESRPISHPLRFLTQAVPNGYLLDPQQEFYFQTVDDFFNAVGKELIKPAGYNFLIRGGKLTSDELCFEIKLMYQSNYQKELEILLIKARGLTRLEKKPDVIEVTLKKIELEILRKVLSQISSQSSGVEPSLLDELLTQNQPILKTSMVLSNSSWSKPELTNVAQAKDLNRARVKNSGVLKQSRLKSSQKPLGQTEKTKPHLAINRVPGAEQPQIFKKTSPLPSIEDKITPSQITQSVNKLFSKRRVEQKTERRSVKAVLMNRIKKKSGRKKAIFAGGFVLLVLGIVFATLVATLSINFRQSRLVLEQNIDYFLQDNNFLFQEIDANLLKRAEFLDKFLDIHLIQKSRDLVRINHQLVELSQEIKNSRALSIAIFDHLFLKTSSSIELSNNQDLVDSDHLGLTQPSIGQLTKLKETKDRLIFEKLSLFHADLDELPVNNFSIELDNKFARTLSQLKEMRSRNLMVQQLDQILPSLMGVDQKQVFYLLLQDESELRPTGGFIEGLVMLVIEDGRLVDWQVFNTNQIDDKVLGKIAAPPEVQSFLGETSLYFRDANWDPDFNFTSQRLSWFIKESLNQPVDGIIGINYSLVKNILALIGDVKIEGQEEVINSWNLSNRLELALSEQQNQVSDKNFYTLLLEAILHQLPNLEDAQKIDFFNLFFQSLRDQQALLYLRDTELSGTVSQLGWSGSLAQPECPNGFGESCVVDQVYQVEANIGVNKINPYVNQSIVHSIEIAQDKIVHQRHIKFVNKARSNIWPLGKYKFYLRFYVNPETTLDRIELNGERMPEDQVLNYIDHNRKVFGLVAEVETGKELEIGLYYSNPLQIEPGQSYFFFDQLQPGLKKRPAVISLKHLQTLRATRISPQAEVNNNQLVVTSDIGSGFVVVKFE